MLVAAFLAFWFIYRLLNSSHIFFIIPLKCAEYVFNYCIANYQFLNTKVDYFGGHVVTRLMYTESLRH